LRLSVAVALGKSIVWQAFRTPSDIAVTRESIEGRLFALSRSHDLLVRGKLGECRLVDIVNEALGPFGVANGRAERFVIAGSNIRSAPKATLALGIALHELATNAVKKGAFSNHRVQS
jgi:two-component sensor histidine kinase